MTTEIAKSFLDIYLDYFMMPTLHSCDQRMKIPAFNKIGKGFPGHYIIVDFQGPRHPYILASTIIKKTEKAKLAYISVSPVLQDLSTTKQKFVLAHEWLHAMLGFQSKQASTITNYSELLLLYYSSNNISCFWQDTIDVHSQMIIALRHLLVPRVLIEKSLKNNFNLDFKGLISLAETSSNEACTVLETFIKSFSAQWNVDPELVYSRLAEEIFGNR